MSTEGSLVENDKEENKNEVKTGESNKEETENKSETQSTAVIDEKEDNNSNISTNESVSINANASYFTELKLKRDNIYSQKLEVYSQMINSNTISSEQKSIAIQEVSTITETQNAIQVAEELIKLKGFENVVIYVNGDSVSVVVRSAALSLEQVAQIQNIVSRELKIDASKISISNK